ncbi:ANK1, partial [Symbiodinium sp. CCMP2456]
MLPSSCTPMSAQVVAGPLRNCQCSPPAQLVHAGLRSFNAVVFAIASCLAVKSRRWPGVDRANAQPDVLWPDPGAALREAGEEHGLVLEDCTASVSLDEMRPHRMGGLIDGWAAHPGHETCRCSMKVAMLDLPSLRIPTAGSSVWRTASRVAGASAFGKRRLVPLFGSCSQILRDAEWEAERQQCAVILAAE